MQAQGTASSTAFGDDIDVRQGRLTVRNEAALRSAKMDTLVRQAVFGEGQAKDTAQWMIWETAQAVGVRPASIHDLYAARGRGEVHGFTVPAMNVRGMSYDTARAIFRTAVRMNAGAFILEIARSEIAYTAQRPSEYVTVMLAAALREGFRGPVFIQGDHFQVNAKKFAADPTGEVAAVKQLALEAISAGFYNIDVDTSTLVDIHLPTLEAQQELNYETAAEIAAYVRSIEPSGVTISIGGEIGEVGTQNSTVPELRAFMSGFVKSLERRAPGAVGLSKISVQTGTSHGGIVLPDGGIADVKLDLEALEALSKVARDEFGMSGAVQHGASTLPESAFDNFPRIETAEIHLATNFQNILFEQMPAELRARIYQWLDENAKEERKKGDSDEQFYYKSRKKALGPFKRELWDLPEEVRATLARAYDKTFGFLFEQLRIGGTADAVERFVLRRSSAGAFQGASRWRPRPTIRTLANDQAGAAPSLWLGALARLAGRAAHELKNPLNGLALNLEVVRSRSTRAGTEGAALAPYAAAASAELERTIPLVDALLALARPVANPVDLRIALQPFLVLYGAIATAGGGSLAVVYEGEQMFVAADGDTVRALLAEALDVTIGANLEVTGRVAESDGALSLRLIGGAGRPIAAKMEGLATARDIRLNSDEDETHLLFPALARAGVDSTT